MQCRRVVARLVRQSALKVMLMPVLVSVLMERGLAWYSQPR